VGAVLMARNYWPVNPRGTTAGSALA